MNDLNNDFLYETPLYHECWQEYLAPKFDIVLKKDDCVVQRKSLLRSQWQEKPWGQAIQKNALLKNLSSLREARLSGWNSAWSQKLTMNRLNTLHRNSDGWDYFRMFWREEHRDPKALDWLKEKGYHILEQPAPVQHWIDLSEGLEGYLKGLSHNSRKSLKKKTRVGQALNPVLVPCVASPLESSASEYASSIDSQDKSDSIEAFFDELFGHHIAYWDVKAGYSYFNDLYEQRFVVNWAKAIVKADPRALVLDRLVMNGETVNLSMGILQNDTFYWLLTVNTGLHADYAPGIIGLYMRLEQMAAQGVKEFKMGAGDYFYKIQSANRQDSCQELIVCNPRSLKGKAYFHVMNYAMSRKSKEAP